MTHTLIIGSGITGATLAYECAQRGDRVTILSAHPAGGLASAASFGWINASFYHSPAHFALRVAGMQAHRRLSAKLNSLPTQWPGCLWYEDEGAAQDEMAQRLLALGYSVQPQTRAQIAARLPDLRPVPETALLFTDEGFAHPAILARALIAVCGAEVVETTVSELTTTDAGVTGVQTDAGPIAADRVVLAGGIGSPALLAPLGLTLPMLDRPGLILTTAPVPPICPLILATPIQEVRQDAQGRLWAPASASHQSDTATHLETLPEWMEETTLARLQTLFPAVTITAQGHVAANRPVPGDGLPVAGPSRIPGLWIAVMHSGATLAPAVAALLAAEMHGGPQSTLLAEFRPARFGL